MGADRKLRAAIYARVSTADKGQDPDLQLGPLRQYCQARAWKIAGEYVDHMTGARDRRPELDRLMDAARKRQIDTVIVWKLDRFGRSLKHLVTALDELGDLGVGFVSYTESIDFSTAAGRLMLHIIGAMAEFERALIKERVRAGLDNAKRKGKRLGRKPVPPIDRKKIIGARQQYPDLSIRALAAQLKMKPGTVHKTLSEFKAGNLDMDGFHGPGLFRP